jgi:YHS domain-containing protein
VRPTRCPFWKNSKAAKSGLAAFPHNDAPDPAIPDNVHARNSGGLMAIDPVCGMDVNEDNPPAKTQYDGAIYYFCSETCRTTFEEDPEEYIRPAA